MKKIKMSIVVLFCAVALTSCYTSEVFVGNVKPNQPLTKVVDRKNHHIIYGLVPLNREQQASDFVGDRKDYVVKIQQSFIDGLVSLLTSGIYTPHTTEYYVPVK